MKNKFLTGENVLLRGVEPGDADFILRMENDPEVWPVSNTIVPFSRFQVEQYALATQHDIFSEKQLRLMIDIKLSGTKGKTIGAIDLYDFDPYHKRAGVGILIIKEDREKGYASESLELLINYSFKVLLFHQLYCSISPENTPSIHLFEKHGFVKCGIRKEWRLSAGKWTDEIMFQLINSYDHQ